MTVLQRHNVKVSGARRAGDGLRPWLRVRPEHVALRGAGLRGPLPGHPVRPCRRGRLGPFAPTIPARYASLDGYADDVVEICRRAGRARRRVRRPLGQRDDRRAGRQEGARACSRPGAGRPLAALHRRRRSLRRRLQRGADPRAARVPGQQPHGLVAGDGAGDHGQPRSAGARRGADQQLLPHRSGDRQAVRAGDLPVRQPRRPGGSDRRAR